MITLHVNYHRNNSSTSSVSPFIYVRQVRQGLPTLCWVLLGSGAVSGVAYYRYKPKRAVSATSFYSSDFFAPTWASDGGVDWAVVKAFVKALVPSQTLLAGRSGRKTY